MVWWVSWIASIRHTPLGNNRKQTRWRRVSCVVVSWCLLLNRFHQIKYERTQIFASLILAREFCINCDLLSYLGPTFYMHACRHIGNERKWVEDFHPWVDSCLVVHRNIVRWRYRDIFLAAYRDMPKVTIYMPTHSPTGRQTIQCLYKCTPLTFTCHN